MAPEVFKNNYNEKCDIWSIGVILFLLIEGKPPFIGQNEGETKMKIGSMKYKFSSELENYSEKGEVVKDLIAHMLIKEDERFNAQEVLNHRWIKEKEKNIPYNIEDLLNQIKLYQKMDNFEKKIISFIASRLNSDEVENLKNFFVYLDENNDGRISKKEFELGVRKVSIENIEKVEIDNCFDNIDTNEDSNIEYTEFIASCINKGLYLDKNNLREIFDAIDNILLVINNKLPLL
jgi:calcium-dependent protein kinase